MFEELIHHTQIKNGMAIPGNEQNRLELEILAQLKLIKHQKAYDITDYEQDNLINK